MTALTKHGDAYDLDALRTQVREMKLEGKGYHQIANKLGITAERAFALCCDGFVMPSSGRAIAVERGVQAARLDRILGEVLEIASDATLDPETRLKAISQIVNIETRRAKLLGLDSPERLQAVVATFGEEVEEKPKITPQMAAAKMRELFGLVGPEVKTTGESAD